MNVLVIGGNRFFGKKLVRKLLQNDHTVTILNRQNLEDEFGAKVQRIKCDRKDTSAMRAALSKSRWDLVYDQVCYEASEAKAACEIFSDRTTHYVFTSSQSVYGAGALIKEASFDPLAFKFSEEANSKTAYAEAKRQCEAVFFAQQKFSVTAVRFPFVVGEDDYTGRLKWHVDRVMSGEPIYFPNIDANISFIHSNDAAEVLFALGTKHSVGAFNASSSNPISLASLINLIEGTVGKKSILTIEKTDSEQSPFGVDSDWSMSTDKLESVGVSPREIQSWLPELLTQLS